MRSRTTSNARSATVYRCEHMTITGMGRLEWVRLTPGCGCKMKAVQ